MVLMICIFFLSFYLLKYDSANAQTEPNEEKQVVYMISTKTCVFEVSAYICKINSGALDIDTMDQAAFELRFKN